MNLISADRACSLEGMNAPRGSKLTELQRLLPASVLVTKPWFGKMGFSPIQISKYVQTGWLSSPARGVFSKAGFKAEALPKNEEEKIASDILWENVVLSLQLFMDEPFILTGEGALAVYEMLPAGSPDLSEVTLINGSRLPSWVRQVLPNMSLTCRKENLFVFPSHQVRKIEVDPRTGFSRHCDPHYWGLQEITWGWESLPLLLSTPERALLEFLELVPHRINFDYADQLFAQLQNLDADRINQLAKACVSFKVRRLLLWLGEKHGHSWTRCLQDLDLGKGKRALALDGDRSTHKYLSKYLITVPSELI